MAPASGLLSALQRFRRRGGAWFTDNDHATVKLVVAITLLALVLRIALLGARVAHFDEGRVAYWAWHFEETGSFAYRYIIHGPFIQHVDRWLFALVGPNDFTMRLPVAVVGGLLPLAALLFRRHLSRGEVVALALLLTLDPVLLYFSRFMRSDVLVAAFMFTALGMLVRLYDTRKARYMYAATVFMALGFASKENALVYVVTWLGATGLLLAKVLVLPNGFTDAINFMTSAPSAEAIRDRVGHAARARVRRMVGLVRGFRERHAAAWQVAGGYVGHVVLAVLAFVAVSLFFYAPRGAGVEGIQHPPVAATAPGYVGFWEGVTDPALFGQLWETTTERTISQWRNWLGPGTEKSLDTYLNHFWVSTDALITGSRVVAGLAAVGYVLDRLSYTTPRHLVPFMFYAGFVSVFGYPLGTDIGAPWLATHAIVFLVVPAAVALAAVVRWGTRALAIEDTDRLGSATLLMLVVSLLVAQSAVGQVYTNTTEEANPLVQYAQPGAELKDELREVDRLATAHGNGTDVVVYYGESGDQFDEANAYVGPDRSNWNDSWWNNRPTCMMWYNSLPLAWYIAADDMDVECENTDRNLTTMLREDPPPVVVTQSFDPTVPEMRLEAAGYEGETYRMRTSGGRNRFTVWTNPEYADTGSDE